MTALHNLYTDGLDAMRHCQTDEERWRCGAGLLQDCGSEWITAGTAVRSTGSALTIRSTTPETLMQDYMDQQLYLHDPWMKLCANGSDLDHLDVARETLAPTRRDKMRMSRLFRDHGVRHALLVPCYGGARSGGVVLYARNAAAAESLSRPEGLTPARVLVALFATCYRPDEDNSLSPQLYTAQNTLTARECEVLQWCFTGLRTSMIADRMGLQDVTVSKHFQSIRRKLKARTREQALAIAVRDGLIRV